MFHMYNCFGLPDDLYWTVYI